MLSSIEPITLCISDVDINRILGVLLNEVEALIYQKGIRIETSLSTILPKIQCDEGLLIRAFDTLVKHAVLSMPEEDLLIVSTSSADEYIYVTIRYTEEGLSEEDLGQFFFPRFTSSTIISEEELPLSKIIIHRHGGKVEVSVEEKNLAVIKVRLPIRQ